ncbi:hypothetical protein GHT06_009549 [Daphnia sinensis]|uniref:Uncharacterized protein n=1 Tax=Daphnia sinensis TaxID=1820382 RepID=A0AAD5Q020_9CRUS|nr:hypothetical protein GHT06_009549 [Daphnia sinensis]
MYSARTSRGERGGFSHKDVMPDACTMIHVIRHIAKQMPGAQRHFCCAKLVIYFLDRAGFAGFIHLTSMKPWLCVIKRPIDL